MSDLIDRDAVMLRVREFIGNPTYDEIMLVNDLNALPSVKPERHRGEWIEDGHERGFSECSKCGYIAVSVLSERLYNFCPNCGAEMSGE